MRHPQAAGQCGAVLIITLIMLVVVSMLASMSIREALSTENVSDNVRSTSLATQAAEVALRYCEDATIQIVSGNITLGSVPTVLAYATPPVWSTVANWDNASSSAFVLPLAALNQSGLTTSFRRAPECMVEHVPLSDASGLVSTSTTYVVTARGFGPEVPAADASRSRPNGSEVWLQSEIELQ